MIKQALKGFVAAGLFSSVLMHSAHAQWAVFDVANFIKNTTTSMQAVTQEMNQLRQIEQEIKANTANFDLSGSAGMSDQLASVRSVSKSAQVLKSAIGSSQDSFSNLQSVFGAGNYQNWGEFSNSINRRKALGDASANNLYQSAQTAMRQVQLASDNHQQIVDKASSVTGVTEAAQSTTAAVGVLIQQQNTMLAVQAAQNSEKALDVSKKAKEAQESEDRYMAYKKKEQDDLKNLESAYGRLR